MKRRRGSSEKTGAGKEVKYESLKMFATTK